MIGVTELRAGKIFKEEGQPFLVLKYEHNKVGRGTANIKVKVKNLKTGAIVEKTFISGARVEKAIANKRKLQYLYSDQANFYFINPKSFEQFSLPASLIGEQADFLQEEAIVNVLFIAKHQALLIGEEPVSLELEPRIKFRVEETGPGLKGDSATNIFKPAILANGMKIKVPLFIKTGEEIWVDTRTREYVERVKS